MTKVRSNLKVRSKLSGTTGSAQKFIKVNIFEHWRIKQKIGKNTTLTHISLMSIFVVKMVYMYH